MNDETEEAMKRPRCGVIDVDGNGFSINNNGMEKFVANR